MVLRAAVLLVLGLAPLAVAAAPLAVAAAPASQPVAAPASQPGVRPTAPRPDPGGAAPGTAAPGTAAPGPATPGPAARGAAPAPAPVPASAARRVVPAYENGFVLRTADRRNQLKIQGSFQLDGRYYPDSAGTPNSLDLRRARFDLKARLAGFIDFRLQVALEDSPYVRNAFADLDLHEAFHLRLGQMKVPFSASWLTMDNNLDFLERATSEPIYPFIDRGVMVWGRLLGRRVTYAAGVFQGVGVDVDSPKGGPDDHVEWAYRLFLQPFRDAGPWWLRRVFVGGGGTYGRAGAPTKRFEGRGLSSSDFESLVWRWRFQQTLGSTGRDVDQITATIGSRQRWGAEAHWLLGPVTLSAEWAMIDYDDITIWHELWQGTTRVRQDPVWSDQGLAVHSVSGFVSWYLTGERKLLDAFGWRQPSPRHPLGGGARGYGAFEVVARFSRTWVPQHDHGAFTATRVAGYASADGTGIKGPLPAEGASVNAQVLDGAKLLYETTVGLNWTLNYHVRVQVNYTYQVAPNVACDAASGACTGGLVSGGNSDNSDPLTKNRQVKSEHLLGARFILRL